MMYVSTKVKKNVSLGGNRARYPSLYIIKQKKLPWYVQYWSSDKGIPFNIIDNYILSAWGFIAFVTKWSIKT